MLSTRPWSRKLKRCMICIKIFPKRWARLSHDTCRSCLHLWFSWVAGQWECAWCSFLGEREPSLLAGMQKCIARKRNPMHHGKSSDYITWPLYLNAFLKSRLACWRGMRPAWLVLHRLWTFKNCIHTGVEMYNFVINPFFMEVSISPYQVLIEQQFSYPCWVICFPNYMFWGI